jgi:hypothetical protein
VIAIEIIGCAIKAIPAATDCCSITQIGMQKTFVFVPRRQQQGESQQSAGLSGSEEDV